MSTVMSMRGRSITSSELFGERPARTIRPPRTVFFKCPEKLCGFEHAQWSLVGQHLFHHHGYSQETIDLEECEQRKTRRNKNWLKKRLAVMDAVSPYVDEEGNEIDEEENRENDIKPSPVVLEAMRKLLPKENGPKDGCSCPLPECSIILPNRVELVNHARSNHLDHHTALGNFEINNELFENEDDFKDWKLRLESECGMYYSCESTGLQGRSKNYFFVCHRSGRVVRRMKQLRDQRQAEREAAASAANVLPPSPKKRNKIVKSQEYCTAFLRARRDALGRFHVVYSTSHIGHDQNPAMLPLTTAMKKLIYDRIAAEHETSSMALIASRIRDSFHDENSRLHYVSMADVIEVIRMERKRLAKVGGEEEANALEIFRTNSKKGRRKIGEELLITGERHKPPRGLGRRRREDMEMDNEIHQDYHDRTIKLDVDELEEEMEEGVMHGDHGEYYDEEGEELVHAGFEDEEVVDESMLETSQQGDDDEIEDEDEMSHLTPSSSRVIDRPTQRVTPQLHQPERQQPRQGVIMEEAVSNKHRMDEHVDNICEALVRNGDPALLQSYLDAIRSVSSRYEHLLRR